MTKASRVPTPIRLSVPLALALAATGLTPVPATAATVHTFSETGKWHEYTVPTGTSWIGIVAIGPGGGGGGGGTGVPPIVPGGNGGAGGGGAAVSCDYWPLSGEKITLWVGAGGMGGAAGSHWSGEHFLSNDGKPGSDGTGPSLVRDGHPRQSVIADPQPGHGGAGGKRGTARDAGDDGAHGPGGTPTPNTGTVNCKSDVAGHPGNTSETGRREGGNPGISPPESCPVGTGRGGDGGYGATPTEHGWGMTAPSSGRPGGNGCIVLTVAH
ncbi:hypothetical protein NOGI109294_23135 [Nocardiopsis gilva]